MDSKPRLADEVAVVVAVAVFAEFFLATEVSKLNLKRHYTSRIMKTYIYKRFGRLKILHGEFRRRPNEFAKDFQMNGSCRLQRTVVSPERTLHGCTLMYLRESFP